MFFLKQQPCGWNAHSTKES